MLATLLERITRLAIRFRWLTILLAAILLVAGMLAMKDLNLELLPRIEIPQTIVVARWPGVISAEHLLEEVTLPLEDALSDVSGVVNVESMTNSKLTYIVVRNDFRLNQERVRTAIEAAVAATELPSDMEAPQVLDFSLANVPVLVVSVSSSQLSPTELKRLMENGLRPRLQRVEQVSQIVVSGGQELPAVEMSGLVGQDDETQAVVAVPTPRPGRLPLVVIEGAKALGMEIEYAQDVTPDVLMGLEGTAEQLMAVLRLIPPETLLYAPGETLALLPSEYVETLDPAVRADLELAAAEFGGVGRLNLAQVMAVQAGADPASLVAEPVVEEDLKETEPVPRVKAVALPKSWMQTGAAVGLTLETTADANVEAMSALLAFDPQLVNDLQPEMWRALAPGAAAIALPEASDSLDPTLLAQLEAMRLAEAGIAPRPVALPESWVAAAQSVGVTLETTADVPAEAVGQLTAFAPVLLNELSDEILLALAPEVIAELPATLTSSLDMGMQQTLDNVVSYWQQRQLESSVGVAQAPVLPAVPLPDSWVIRIAEMGQTVTTTADLEPETMATIVSETPARLAELTPQMWRVLKPSAAAIALEEAADNLDPSLLMQLEAIQRFSQGEVVAVTLPESWITTAAGLGFILETTADVSAELMSLLAEFAPHLLVDLTPEMLLAFEPAVLAELPNEHFADQDMGLRQTIEIILILHEQATVGAEVAGAGGDDLEVDRARPPEAYSEDAESQGERDALTSENGRAGGLTVSEAAIVDADAGEQPQDIATDETEAFVPEASIARRDGDPSLIVELYKDEDASTVQLVHRLLDELALYSDENPDVEIDPVIERGTLIEDSLSGLAQDGVLGAAFSVTMILIFMSGRVGGRYKLNWRPSLVAGASITLSMFATLLLMRWMPPTIGTWLRGLFASRESAVWTIVAKLFPTSITLNIITLSGLMLAISRVVTDSVVVLDSSCRSIQRGQDRVSALVEGIQEVAVVMLSATAMTAGIFLPLGWIDGLASSLFLPLGLTVTYALAVSFLVSITVTPALAYLLIRPEHIPEKREAIVPIWPRFVLRKALNYRGYTIVAVTLVFVFCLFLLRQLPRNFIPGIGEQTITLSITLPDGTPMAETNDQVLELERQLVPLARIEQVLTEVGGGDRFQTFRGSYDVSQNKARIMISVSASSDLGSVTNEIRAEAEAIFGADRVKVTTSSYTDFSSYSMILTSDSLQDLRDLVPHVKQKLEAVDIDGDGKGDIVNVSSSLDYVDIGPDEADRRLRINGRPALSFVGDLETENELGAIVEARRAILDLDLPAGSKVNEGFILEQLLTGFRGMAAGIGYSVLVVYLIMAMTVRSPIRPLPLLFSLPLALVGAIITLYATGNGLGLAALLGLMLLVGFVASNAVLLLVSAHRLRQQGKSANEAILRGGRPYLSLIWKTTLAMILALVPLGMRQESGANVASEIALVVMGGLLVSTALTPMVGLLVYGLFDELGGKIRRSRQHSTE